MNTIGIHLGWWVINPLTGSIIFLPQKNQLCHFFQIFYTIFYQLIKKTFFLESVIILTIGYVVLKIFRNSLGGQHFPYKTPLAAILFLVNLSRTMSQEELLSKIVKIGWVIFKKNENYEMMYFEVFKIFIRPGWRQQKHKCSLNTR